jgi:homoserine O-acetyltransferase
VNYTVTYTIPVEIPNLKFFHSTLPFPLEAGGSLPELTIAYHTYGTLNTERNNVIWVCHALTANSNVADWWAGLFGPGNVFDPDRYFIVCANIIGSCYGSTGPRSINPATGKAYSLDFPLVTIRDWARAHDLLRQHLDIQEIALCIGGSCGGHQVLEFACLLPKEIKKMALLVTSARETAWAIAIHEAQRMAMQADSSFYEDKDTGGAAGMRAARGMGLVTYRTFEAYQNGQTDSDEKLNDLKSASYIQHQGKKLEQRFYAQCYWFLSKALDSHNMGRGRGGAAAALSELQIPALVLSIDSDLLIPPSEQRFLAEHLPQAEFVMLESAFGHDGFLIETERIGAILREFRT